MSEIPRPLGPAELADERVEFLPARTVLTTVWFPIHTPNDLTVLHQVHHHPDPDDDNISTGDVTGGAGGTGGGQGGGQGGGNGGNGGDGGSGGDGGDGGDGGNGIGGDGIGGAGIGGDGGGNIG